MPQHASAPKWHQFLTAGALLAFNACGEASSQRDSSAGRDASEGKPTLLDSRNDDAPSCATSFLQSGDDSVRRATVHALEIATAASSSYSLEAMISLTDPPYDFGSLDIEARQAQLAPYQDPIVSLVERAGGVLVDRLWLVNLLLVRIPAEHVAESFCWPEVKAIEVSTPFWDAVEPPWDVESVGSSECPIVDGACPEHCEPIDGLRMDEAQQCVVPTAVLVACSKHVGLAYTDDEKCRVNGITGAVYWLGGAGPSEPEFRGFRECTTAEYESAFAAPQCDR